MQWWALAHQQFGIPEQLLFAIPNGGHDGNPHKIWRLKKIKKSVFLLAQLI